MSPAPPSLPVLPLVRRDLTDPNQNAEILALATRLEELPDVNVITALHGLATDPQGVAETSPILLEALSVAAARARLRACTGPLHLSVVWAMYGETGRMSTRADHPHGEDFLRVKVAQLEWLFQGLGNDFSWSIVACDDGCPDAPSSGTMMQAVIDRNNWAPLVRVVNLADAFDRDLPLSQPFRRLRSTEESRKGGSILYGLWEAVSARSTENHVVVFTDADLSANLAQAGSLVAQLDHAGAVACLGQRYGAPGSILVKETGASAEPHSTGNKPDKLIVLFRHFVRAMLIPTTTHVLDTQAGFKAFGASALAPILPLMTSFNETFDVELLIHLARAYGAEAIKVQPIVFTEDFAATNFPSVEPGQRHVDMVHQMIEIYDRFVHPHEPATGEAAELLRWLRSLDLERYKDALQQVGDRPATGHDLFETRWNVDQLTAGAAS